MIIKVVRDSCNLSSSTSCMTSAIESVTDQRFKLLSWKCRHVSPLPRVSSSCDRHHHPHHRGDQHAPLPRPADCIARTASGLPGGAVPAVPACTGADRIWSPGPHVSTLPSEDVLSRTAAHLPGSQWVSLARSLSFSLPSSLKVCNILL